MPVEVIWDNEEKTIIRQIYSGVLVLDDYKSGTDQFLEMAHSVPHTVHTILDRQNVEEAKASSMKAMQYANERMPENIGLRIVLKPNKMSEAMINMGRYLAPDLVDKVEIVDSVEEAHQKVAEYEKSQA